MIYQYTGKAAAHPVLRRACVESIHLAKYGNEFHPATAAKFWKVMNDATTVSAAFRSILSVAAEKDMPKHYPCDLDCDRDAIMKNGDHIPFFWAIRNNGTSIVPLDGDSERSRRFALEWFRAEVKTFPDLEWYEWDGHTLHRRLNVESIDLEIRQWINARKPAEVR